MDSTTGMADPSPILNRRKDSLYSEIASVSDYTSRSPLYDDPRYVKHAYGVDDRIGHHEKHDGPEQGENDFGEYLNRAGSVDHGRLNRFLGYGFQTHEEQYKIQAKALPCPDPDHDQGVYMGDGQYWHSCQTDCFDDGVEGSLLAGQNPSPEYGRDCR